MGESEQLSCPDCRSKTIAKAGMQVTKSGKVQRYRCNNCAYVGTEDTFLTPSDKEDIFKFGKGILLFEKLHKYTAIQPNLYKKQ